MSEQGQRRSRPSGSEQRQRTKLVGLRLLPDEYALLDQEAQRRNTTVTALARNAALALISEEAVGEHS